MAYSESGVGGSIGGAYRVWVNSIRTHDGSQADNSEDWRVEGGLNKISTGNSAWSNYNNASYTLQLGLNGVASSGNFNYNFGSGTTGTVLSWGTGATKVYRSSAGVGFGFQSRMDINLQNSPYLTSGWVTSNDSVQTKYRQATITNVSGNVTDLSNPWVEFSNPASAQVNVWFEFPNLTGATRYHQRNSVGSRYTWTLTEGERNTMRNVLSNVNSSTIRYVVETYVGGSYFYDTRNHTYSIVNTAGEANPTFSDFDFLDTNSATVAVTGDNQVLISGKSTLQATVAVADKAISNKQAEMSTYGFSLGGYSQSSAWSNTVDVVKDIGVINDVTGVQNLSVRAVDSRGNSKTVTKPVTILPYGGPGFFYAMTVKYANEFDASEGLAATGYDTNAIALVSPLTLDGDDLNDINTTTGVKFQLSKGEDPWDNVWTNVTITQDAGTGLIRTNLATLATAVLDRMNTIGADNTQPWYIWFSITDKLEDHDYVLQIDIGRPIMRIGTDSLLYHKEEEFSRAFSENNKFIPGQMGLTLTGTWSLLANSTYLWNPVSMANTATKAQYDVIVYPFQMARGQYDISFIFTRGPDAPTIAVYLDNVLTFEYDLYQATANELRLTLTDMEIWEAGPKQWAIQVTGKNASSSSYYLRVVGITLRRQGDPE